MVLGAPEPEPLGETARAGTELHVTPQHLLVPEVTDILRSDNSLDLQQRGTGNVQTDISIRGASFEQTLVLINGLRINDAETSHFNLDVPLPLDAIFAVDVLHGAGSTLYGSDALGGVVDLRTNAPETSAWNLRSSIGSYGMNAQAASASYTHGPFEEGLAASRDFSTGFIADRDYRSEQASSETWFRSPLGESDILFAGSDRSFGADDFYGAYPSFEQTKGWFASMQQQLGASMDAALAYRRHTDRFVLLRSDPGYYTNQHIDDSWQVLLRRRDRLGTHTRVSTGLEEDLDSILSSNLGNHARNRGAGYAQLEVGGLRGTLSAGAREEVLSGGRSVFSPSFAFSKNLGKTLKLRGSVGYGFRLPTFTDLYYSDPTTSGNAQLQAESAWSYEAGADWFLTPHLLFAATGFVSPQHDAIDYTRASSGEKWQATNLGEFRYAGVETSVLWQSTVTQSLRVGWTYIAGDAGALGGLQSEYVFHYPVNNSSVEWMGPLGRRIRSRARLGVTQRVGQAPYAVLDTSLSRAIGSYCEPYIQMTNLTNTGYEEIQGVRVQGRAFLGGIAIHLTRR